MAAGSRITGRAARMVARVRQRSELVDHLFRTAVRYLDRLAGRLAAAAAYYAFFAVFALGLVGFAVLGFLVEREADLREGVDDLLQENLPVIDVGQISAGRETAGVFGLIGLLVAGLAWVAALRSSQRLIWGLRQEPGNLIVRRLLDLVALLLLAVLLGASLLLAVVIEWLLAGIPLVNQLGWLLTVGVNLVLAAGLLAALPRLRLSPRRLLPPAAAVAVGLLVLNTVGRLYLDRVQANPAYSVVATAAGLLVYLYLVHQLLLAAAAWAATARYGQARDLAGGGALVVPADAADAADAAADAPPDAPAADAADAAAPDR